MHESAVVYFMNVTIAVLSKKYHNAGLIKGKLEKEAQSCHWLRPGSVQDYAGKVITVEFWNAHKALLC